METTNVSVNEKRAFSEKEIYDFLGKVNWDKKGMDGMIPVIAQDVNTREVLMQAYANKEAFANTLRSGNATYWSRSRNELWEKGLTSGAT
ncbi:MAG: phosphoribosyl-AMP cyclohydrolase, partial [Candidatus Gracilibacteria bacterium]|nr:phosphoribosyl-AMP cyclohydrolase [Candidatus Gracilibacteria bacterium]